MSLPTFNGSTTKQFKWQNDLINTPGGTPNRVFGYPRYQNPPQTQSQILQAIRTYDPFNQIINWDISAPSFLNNNTLSQLWASPQPNVLYSIRLVFTVENGFQSGRANINLNIYQGSSLLITTNIAANEPGNYCPVGTVCPGFTLTLPTTESGDTTPYTLQALPWSRDVTSFTLSAQLFVSVTVTCETLEDLESGFCFNYCKDQNPVIQNQCLPVYEKNCLIDKNSEGNLKSNLNIFTSEACQSFISQNIQNIGPNSDIDNALDAACKTNFVGFVDLEAQPAAIVEICACHMNPTLYDELRKSILDEFPQFAAIAEKERCLYPKCVDSPYTTVNIGKQCMVPKCINIADITNKGTIKGGTQIIQSAECANLDSGGGNGNGNGNGDTTPNSWIDRHWVWIVVGVGILVVLIIAILIILAGENNKKKPPQPRLIPE